MAKHKKHARGPWPIWKLVLADVLALGLALVVFALFHHVIPRQEQAVGTVSRRVSSAVETATAVPSAAPTAEAPAEPLVIEADGMQSMMVSSQAPAASSSATPEPTPSATPEPTATPDPVGYFGTKFADKFTDGEVVRGKTSYQSENLNITVKELRKYDTNIYVADVYVKDITCLRAAFAKDKYGRAYTEWPTEIAERLGAVLTVNGDFYGGRSNGIVIRNGKLYREDDNPKRDVAVLYWDGTMECFSPWQFDLEQAMERGAYQAWNFGPMLLDEDGGALTEFNSSVAKENPRAVIGYFEPGHYCLIAVDGRSEKSDGITLKDLSKFCSELGLKQAYNLDGGATTAMVCGTQRVNHAASGGRACSDFIVLMDDIISEGTERG